MKISIIIPVYNKADFIETCLKSLLEQSFDDFEVVCIDDGSNDLSGQILDRMAHEETRIRVVHKTNGGVTAARRMGVELAKGQYIMFVDADDGLMPGALQTMYDAIELSGADEVIAPFCTFHGVKSPVVYEGLVPTEPLVRYIITSKNRFPVLWSIIFRRELLNDVLDTPREIIEGEDKLMQVKLLLTKHPRVFFIKDYIYRYNLGLPNNRKRTLEHEKLYDKLLKEVLAPRMEEFHKDFVLHQLKEYERFIYNGQLEVRQHYYKEAIGKLPTGIPLYDKIVFWLPPSLAQYIVRIYRKLINIKQKGL